MKYHEGTKAYISGEVKYGDRYYRVASPATILNWNRGAYALCMVSEIDGDRNVCVYVEKKVIGVEESREVAG